VDLDWEHVRAVDIFAALRSFLPNGGRVEAVTVYPSDYGLQRMKEEATSGPQARVLGRPSGAAGSMCHCFLFHARTLWRRFLLWMHLVLSDAKCTCSCRTQWELNTLAHGGRQGGRQQGTLSLCSNAPTVSGLFSRTTIHLFADCVG